jgi:ribosomal protein L37AE/L43A
MNTPTNSEAFPLTNCSASSDAEKYAEPHGSKERVEEQLRIALAGHTESELWGENGLIAATMRAARVASKLEDMIQKFRDEADCLLLDKSSRALGGAIAYGAMADELSKLISLPNARDLAPPQAVEDDADEEESCEYCGNGDRVPQEAWTCPKCDAEWPAYESSENAQAMASADTKTPPKETTL